MRRGLSIAERDYYQVAGQTGQSKSGGDRVSYGAFLKGYSRDGAFERNLVICEWKHKGSTRIGLSVGGGGVKKLIACEEGICTPMHRNGIVRNNIILNCPEDVDIYVNEGRQSRILNNTLLNTGGIDVRFKESDAEIRNNVVDGKLRQRNGGTIAAEANYHQSTRRPLRLYRDIPGGDMRIKNRVPWSTGGAPRATSPRTFAVPRRRAGPRTHRGPR